MPPAGVLAGPYVVAAALLALGGMAKLRRPDPTGAALAAGGLAWMAPRARLLGGIEAAVGALALVTGARVLAGLVAAFYLAFAAFVGSLLLRGRAQAGCGCFGARGARPTPVHVGLNAAAAAVAAAVAVGPGLALGATLSSQPLHGVPFVVACVTGVILARAALTLWPEISVRPRRPASTGRAMAPP